MVTLITQCSGLGGSELYWLQIEAANPLTPAEIREALRRYWNSPIGPAASFTRSTASHLHLHLLSCWLI